MRASFRSVKRLVSETRREILEREYPVEAQQAFMHSDELNALPHPASRILRCPARYRLISLMSANPWRVLTQAASVLLTASES